MTDSNAKLANKRELLDQMRTGRAEWDALVAQVPSEAMTAPVLPGGWSVKDLIAHVAAYEKWTAAQIRGAMEGRAPTNMELYGVDIMPDDTGEWDTDRINAAIYERYADAPLDDVTALAQRAFADLVAAVEAVPEEDICRPGAQPWTGEATLLGLVPDQSCDHYRQHLDDLRAVAGEGAY